MVQFLYLLGPGMFAWFVKNKCCQNAEEYHLLTVFAEIISYAFVNMAVILAVLKPLGRVQLVVLPNGQLDVQYGASAVLVSACLAVAIGIGSYYTTDFINQKNRILH